MNELTVIHASNNRIYLAVNGSANIGCYLSYTELNILSNLVFNGEIVFDTVLNCTHRNDLKRFKLFQVNSSKINQKSMSYLESVNSEILEDFESHYKSIDKRIIESSMLISNEAHYYLSGK